jgi:hypothetical protein
MSLPVARSLASMSDWKTVRFMTNALSPYIARQLTVPVVHCAA